MLKFRDKRTNAVKAVFSIRKEYDKVFVKFKENGKEYSYYENNIEILHSTKDLIIYSFEQPCYKCNKSTSILTYLLFGDGTNENLIYPWDKPRLNREKSLKAHMLHMSHSYIEFYPIKTIGSDHELDNFMIKQFPNKIHMEYSATQERIYPMNICEHCSAKQGEFYIYERLNKIIRNMEKLTIHKVVSI